MKIEYIYFEPIDIFGFKVLNTNLFCKTKEQFNVITYY